MGMVAGTIHQVSLSTRFPASLDPADGLKLVRW